MKPDGDILFTKHILKKTAKDLGVDIKVIEYLYSFCIEYLHKQIEATDCCAFELPNLGILYIKEKFLKEELAAKTEELKKNPKDTVNKKQKIALEHKLNLLNTYKKGRKRSSEESYHVKEDRYNCQGKSPEEIQDFQNNIYNEQNFDNS